MRSAYQISTKNEFSSTFSGGCISSYSFGFNGQMKDDEVYGEGNSYDFGARIYDPRLSRWSGMDLYAAKYAAWSPYNFVMNSPLIVKDVDGKDIFIGIAWATSDFATGHMTVYVTKYKDVQVKVIENGKEVTKTYYIADGYYKIQNMPNGNGSATGITQHALDYMDEEFKSIVAVFQVQMDKGISGSSFDPNLNPGLNTGIVYYTEDEIKDEKDIMNEMKNRKDIGGMSNMYKHGDGTDMGLQNDCTSLPVEILKMTGIIAENSALGVTTVEANGRQYSFYTPNEVALDLKDMGFQIWKNNGAAGKFDATVTR